MDEAPPQLTIRTTSLSRKEPLLSSSSSPVDQQQQSTITLLASVTKCSTVLNKPFDNDYSLIEINVTVFKENTNFKWKVYHTEKEIKKNFKQIHDEAKSKSIILKSSIQDIFNTIKHYTHNQIQTNLTYIIKSYITLFNDINISQHCISLKEFFNISKNSFSKFNAGVKPMEGYALKKAEPSCLRTICCCVCNCCDWIYCGNYNKRWIVLKNDMIYHADSSTSEEGKNVFFFDDGIEIQKRNLCIHINNISRSLVLKYNTQFEMECWYNEITLRVNTYKSLMKNNKYDSYTNMKQFNLAHWFVDGKDYFEDLYDKLMQCQTSVFITDWWLSPEVYLKRPVNYNVYTSLEANGVIHEAPYTRLMDVLNHLAKKGVNVYILVYCEMSLALTLNSKHSKRVLVGLDSNIQVIRHPKDTFDLLWSHHEKLVVIDQRVGYVGGVDLCWGRFDVNEHPLYEACNVDGMYMFPGIDYSNGRECDFDNVEDYLKESVCRKEGKVRMPWHDVHLRLEGPVVADIARHFVERWNYAKFDSKETAIIEVKGNASIVNKTKKSQRKINNIPWLGRIIEQQDKKEKKDGKGKEKESGMRPQRGVYRSGRKLPNVIQEETQHNNKDNDNDNVNLIGKQMSVYTNNADDDNDDDIITIPNTNAVSHIERIKSNDNDDEEDITERIGKTYIDENHMMRKLEDKHILKSSAKRKQILLQSKSTFPSTNTNNNNNGGNGEQKHFYDNFLKKMSKYTKKKTKWFKPTDKRLTASMNFSTLRNGTISSCQVLRSISEWSAGIHQTEHSILNGYYHLIDKAKHYIYIENQFFISKAHTNDERINSSKRSVSRVVENEIAYHIRKRIEKAYDNNEKFHVYIFIPLLPGFAGDPQSSSTLQIILKHTYNSISHNSGLSMIEKLKEKMGDAVYDYISFYSLRTHTVVNGKPVTELIYIHSKLMIVDDKKVIIGSANINDRSMLGKRDSEYAVIVKEEYKKDMVMNGKKYKAANFAVTLRKALMAEHLGVDKDDSVLNDPLSDELWLRMKSIAKQNTVAYRNVFGCYPDDVYRNFELLKKGMKEYKEKNVKELYERYKGDIKGHIVEFPLDFLCEEELGISFFSVENLVPERNFT